MIEGFPQDDLGFLAKTLHEAINAGDRRFGFTLVVFPIAEAANDRGIISFISNCDREVYKNILQQLLATLETIDAHPNPDPRCS